MSYELVKIDNSYHNQIKEIWRSCFTPDETYINNFIKYCLPYTNSYGIKDNNSNLIVSCASLLPSQISINNKQIIGGYLYGVATLKEHRGKALSKQITDHIFTKTSDIDYILVKPASESLYNLYKKNGFNNTLQREESHLFVNKSGLNHLTSNTSTRYISSLSERIDYKKVLTIIDQNSTILDDIYFQYRQMEGFHYPINIFKYSIIEALYNGYVLDIVYTDNNIHYFIGICINKVFKISDTNYNLSNICELELFLKRANQIDSSYNSIIYQKKIGHNLNNKNRYIHKDIISIKSDGLIRQFTPKQSISTKLNEFYIKLPME